MAIYYDTEYRERNVDMEDAVPVGDWLPDGERVKVRVLPAIRRRPQLGTRAA